MNEYKILVREHEKGRGFYAEVILYRPEEEPKHYDLYPGSTLTVGHAQWREVIA